LGGEWRNIGKALRLSFAPSRPAFTLSPVAL
jgi:hypothetical protein